MGKQQKEAPDLEELLKLPKKGDDRTTMDEVFDNIDKEIEEDRKRYELENARMDKEMEALMKQKEGRKAFRRENAVFRNRLESELTENALRELFCKNKRYLQDVWEGNVESARHEAFHKSGVSRQALYYKMITVPFTEEQLDWTLEEIGKVWMRTDQEKRENSDYVWKVLLAECFIKFYMDLFNLEKGEAEKRIGETPLSKRDNFKL